MVELNKAHVKKHSKTSSWSENNQESAIDIKLKYICFFQIYYNLIENLI